MTKRWRVNVYFFSPVAQINSLIETRLFRFRFMARFFAWSQTMFGGWWQTLSEVCDQRSLKP
jgi:hypothetical protein